MMKNLIFFASSLTVLSLSVYAQWLPDFRLTISPGFSTNSSIVSNENYLHVVWQDTRDGGNNEIYYKRSTNAGLSWENDVRLTNNIGTSQIPSISVSGTFVYVVWQDNVDGNFEVYFKRSSDNGVNWGGDIRLTNDINVSETPNISASGQFVQLVWRGISNGFYEIFHKHSNDWGATWSLDTLLTTHTSGTPGTASLSTTGLSVHLAWSDSRDGNNEIYYKRSIDGGETWEAERRLTDDVSVSEVPSITASSNGVHLAWLDLRDGNNEIYYKRSTDSGITWSADVRLTMGPFWSQNPSIVLSGTKVHLAYQYGTSSSLEIFYKCSTDNGVNWGDSTQLSNSLSIARDASISASGASTHVIWTDTRHGSTNWEIYYKRNPTGNILGGFNHDDQILNSFSLHQNFPNPFNPTTKISWQSPVGGWQVLKVFDVLGNELVTLVNEHKEAGKYEIDFSAKGGYASGVYCYQLKVGEFMQTKKMILTK